MSEKEKSYTIMRILTAVLVAAGMGFAIATRNLIGGVMILAIGLSLFLFMKTRYKDVVIADERTRKISEKAIAGAFWIYLVSIVLANIAVIFLGPLDLEIIEQVKPAVTYITYTFFFLIFLYEALRFYYKNEM
ncbi:MAG: DUF2178 domain-containing protein [Candidatus Methanoperedens sp.]|nr:DUF2178 domain-containing protein [Candidatus Methanoperedens sp.]MCZ7369780.1 DUF2178 domain-containing protein [Candidatus Methanoperedens sp.]